MNKYQRLANLLIKKTREKNAGWQPTSRNGVFSLSLPDYSVLISMVSSRDDDPSAPDDVLLQIVNADGTVIDRARDTEIAEGMPSADQRAFYTAIQEMYEQARRQAFGVDQALDKLIEE